MKYYLNLYEVSKKIESFLTDIKRRFELVSEEYNITLEDLNSFNSFNETSLKIINFLFKELEENNLRFTEIYTKEFSNLDFFKERNHLLLKGLENFENKEYISSIPLLLSQFEGIVSEFSENKNLTYYFISESGNGYHKFKSNDKKAYFKDIFNSLFSDFSEDFLKSIDDDIYTRIFRHEILHGREKKFNTPKNSFILVFVLFLVMYYIKDKLEEK